MLLQALVYQGIVLGNHLRRQTWFIPYEVTAAETLESFWAAQLVPRMNEVAGFAARQLQAHHPIWGFWLSQGEVYSNLEVGDRRGPARDLLEGDEPLMLTVAALRLAEPQTRILKRRLLALLTEASTWDTGIATEYTLGLILVRGSPGQRRVKQAWPHRRFRRRSRPGSNH